MGKFKESRTAKNLLISFAAEAQARTRYNFFATQALQEGYAQIARIFNDTADEEYEHALRFFKFFNGGDLEITWAYPAGVIKDTRSNLLSAADLERVVSTEMYPVFAKVAVEEGFQRAADTFSAITVAEEHHEEMYLELAENIATGRTFQRDRETTWRCLNCGYLHTGDSPPDKCPACVKPRGYFELLYKNW